MRIPLFPPKNLMIKNGLVAEYRFDQRNLLRYSEQFDNAVWNKVNGVTVEPNVGIAPDGTLSADRVNNFAAILYENLYQIYPCGNWFGKTFTGSVFLKGEGTNVGKKVRVWLKRQTGTFIYLLIDVTLTEEWQKVSMARLTGVIDSVDVKIVFDSAVITNPATSFLVWGAQLELGTTPSDYQKTTDNQTLLDSYGSYNGTLGSTVVSDANDPTWNGMGLSFISDDFVRLPYMINAEQDFTVYLIANISDPPSSNESYISFGHNTVSTRLMYLLITTSGTLTLQLTNDAGASSYCVISTSKVYKGNRLLMIRRTGNTIKVKDVASGELSSSIAPSNPITFNQIGLGTLLRITAAGFLNQPEYFAAFFNRATTDTEDLQVYRYVKKLLNKRGVSI